MKFKCNKCKDEIYTTRPCTLTIKGIKHLTFERENWEVALRRCPFENTDSGKFTGHAPVAEWKRARKVKK